MPTVSDRSRGWGTNHDDDDDDDVLRMNTVSFGGKQSQKQHDLFIFYEYFVCDIITRDSYYYTIILLLNISYELLLLYNIET